MSYNLDLALKYAERSFHVFPCVGHGEKGKHPCPGVFWRSQSTIDPEQIRQWWERWPDAVPALDLDKCGLLALDCDVRDGVHGYDWAREKIGSLDGIPGSRTPSGGQHSIFRNDRDFGNSRGRLPGKEVFLGDVKGKGGYIIAPGARLKEGGYYEPIGDLADAPPIPETLVWYLTPEQPVASAPLARPQIARTITAVGKKTPWALGTMEGMVRDIAGAMPGDRNNMVWRKACKAGRMVRGGLFTYSEALAYLTDGAVQLGLPPKDRVFGLHGALVRGIERGFDEGPSITGSGDSQDAAYDQSYPFEKDDLVARGLAKQEALARDAPDHDPETGEVLEEEEPAQSVVIPFLAQTDHWTKPQGLICEIADWVMATSMWPNWPLAIASATAVIATICGRHLYGPTDTAMNIYTLLLADSCDGKDTPLGTPRKILRAAGFGSLARSARVFSVSRFEQQLVEAPCQLMVGDEIAYTLLTRMRQNKYSSQSDSDIRADFMELWSRNRTKEPFNLVGRYKRPDQKSHERTDIPYPALCLLGACTIPAFYRAMSDGASADGLLSRLLLCPAEKGQGAQTVMVDPNAIPKRILENMCELVPTPTSGNIDAINGIFHIDTVVTPDIHVVPWATPELKEKTDAYCEEVRVYRQGASEIESALLGRVYEYSIRLATLHAVSRAGTRYTEVTGADWAWGNSWACHSVQFMLEGTADYMAESEPQRIAKEIRRALRGKGYVGRQQLGDALDDKYWVGDFKQKLEELISTGKVIEREQKTGKRGPVPKWYRWVGK